MIRFRDLYSPKNKGNLGFENKLNSSLLKIVFSSFYKIFRSVIQNQ